MASFRRQRSPTSDRFLAIFSPPPAVPAAAPVELNEDDIFWSAPTVAAESPENTAPALSAGSPNPSPFLSPRSGLRRSAADRSFGILAALPEEDAGIDGASHFIQRKASISSASSSASNSPSSSFASAVRTIPAVPKPKIEQNFMGMITGSSPVARSAPVNVPLGPWRSRSDPIGDEDDDLNGAGMLPPHEIAARTYQRQSPLVASSVLEGAGRTLKGRDLRQVRNAVFRQTGFLD